jgi:hypothetical protein
MFVLVSSHVRQLLDVGRNIRSVDIPILSVEAVRAVGLLLQRFYLLVAQQDLTPDWSLQGFSGPLY